MTNPLSIVSVIITDNGLRYEPIPVTEVSIQLYYPFQQGPPSCYCFVPGLLAGSIMFDTVQTAGSTVTIRSLKPFNEIVELTEEIAFLSGYEIAICYGLAVLIAPKYGKMTDQTIALVAADSYLKIKSYNAAMRPFPPMRMDAGMPGMANSYRSWGGW